MKGCEHLSPSLLVELSKVCSVIEYVGIMEGLRPFSHFGDNYHAQSRAVRALLSSQHDISVFVWITKGSSTLLSDWVDAWDSCGSTPPSDLTLLSLTRHLQ